MMRKDTVPSRILAQTLRCHYDFCCLEAGEYMGPDGCEVDYLYGENILFLKSKMAAPYCPYRSSFSGRQMCLCPTKYYVASQGEDSAAFFSQCGNCDEIWRNYHEFLSDPYISLTGYQVSFTHLKAGQFLFTHSCGSTLSVTAGAFVHLHDGPIFKERATGTDACPEFCLRVDELRPCPAECECAYIRQVLQIVKGWPKQKRKPFLA